MIATSKFKTILLFSKIIQIVDFFAGSVLKNNCLFSIDIFQNKTFRKYGYIFKDTLNEKLQNSHIHEYMYIQAFSTTFYCAVDTHCIGTKSKLHKTSLNIFSNILTMLLTLFPCTMCYGASEYTKSPVLF